MSHASMDLGLLIIRLAVGITMALHGVNKIRGGIQNTAGWFGSIGMKPPLVQAWMAALTEIGCGALFAAGLLTPLAAAGMISLMIVAYWVAHRKNGFFIFRPNQGWEYVFILGAVAAGVGMIGGGKYSLDNSIDLGWNGSWTGTWITILVGVLAAVALLATCYRPAAAKAAAAAAASAKKARPKPPQARPASGSAHRKRR